MDGFLSLVDQIAENGGFISLLGLLLLIIGLILAISRRERGAAYSQKALDTFAESTADPVRIYQGENGLQAMEIRPSVPPFRRLLLELRPSRTWRPIAFLSGALGGPTGTLHIFGQFSYQPEREMVWTEGSTPAKSFPNQTLPRGWVVRESPLFKGSYATRSSEAAPLILAFTEFQERLRPGVRRVLIQDQADYEMVIEIDMTRIDQATLPHLLALVWALGRAAVGESG